MIYLFILIAKILENAIATFRLIVVANGKKLMGAILNLVVAIIWVFSTGLVVTNILSDPFKVVAFALGSFIGSFVGSIIESKAAIGSNMLFTITKHSNEIQTKLNELNLSSYCLNSNDDDILIIMVERKKRKDILDIIKKIDNDAIIISEVAKQLVFK